MATSQDRRASSSVPRCPLPGTEGEGDPLHRLTCIAVAGQVPVDRRQVGREQEHPTAAHIALDSVGAYSEGQADSEDPARPGVIVRHGHWPQRDALAYEELSLGLEAERNRRDVMILDGAFEHAVIRERTADGFRGTWDASVGPTTYHAAGRFCAVRAPDARDDRD